jgi:hypothetical protein
VFRVFGLLRGVNPMKHSAAMLIMGRATMRSLRQISVVIGYMFVIVIISSSFVFLAEQDVYDEETGNWMRYEDNKLVVSPFNSIFESMWWGFATLTTTGYGDVVPFSIVGRMVAVASMILGILMIALPSSILGANFVAEWQAHERLRFRYHMLKDADKQAVVQMFHGASEEQTMLLREENERLAMVVSDMQERLAELNPPRYYEKYRHVQERYDDLYARYVQLEKQDAQRRQSQDFSPISLAAMHDVQPGTTRSRRSFLETLRSITPFSRRNTRNTGIPLHRFESSAL